MGVEVTLRLRDSLKHHLREVIVHCEKKFGQRGSSYTPSDFKIARVSQSLLDKLEFEINNDEK